MQSSKSLEKQVNPISQNFTIAPFFKRWARLVGYAQLSKKTKLFRFCFQQQMALPSANRLKRRRDFQTVYKAGSRKSTLHLTLRALPFQTTSGTRKAESLSKGPEIWVAKSPTRIGISISQKVSKRAVIRNRIKRQIRAAFRQLLPRIQCGWWLVVVV